VRTVPAGMRQEALAWLRAGNNGATMLANGVAYLTSGVGLAVLFIFDAVSSTFAAILGKYKLPKDDDRQAAKEAHSKAPKLSREEKRWRYRCIVLTSIILAFFTLECEVFFVATAAQAKIAFGERGVEVFSQVMMLNTVCCMIFAVFTSKLFKNIHLAFISGFILQALGLIWFSYQSDKMSAYFFSALLQTAGELAFTSMAQFVLLQCIPSGPKEGRVYAMALVVQLIGKTIGASLAFPYLSGGIKWMPTVIVLTVVFSVLVFVLGRFLRRAGVCLS